ncbi:MAG TPA: DUF3224 domain-containing protein [Jiangellaceae bacterium]
MTDRLETKLHIKSWDEKPYRELADGRKFSRSEVALSASDAAIEAEVAFESLLYYRSDGTSDFTSLLTLDGRLGDRNGSVVLRGTGTYDGTQARVDFVVVPGSGTGELAGISGTGLSVSTHSDYPFMPLTLDYELR